MKTKKLIFLNIIFAYFFTFYCSTYVAAQGDDDNFKLSELNKEIEKYFEPSYVTFGGGYDSERRITSDDIYYEAQIYTHLNWFGNKNGTKNFFRVYLPIRLQVRHSRTESSPVKTPSYNPGIRLYYWNKCLTKQVKKWCHISTIELLNGHQILFYQ